MGAGNWLTFHKPTEKVPDLLHRNLSQNDRISISGISTSPQMPLPTNFLMITLSCLNQADMALFNTTLSRLSTLLPLETRCLFRFIPPPISLLPVPLSSSVTKRLRFQSSRESLMMAKLATLNFVNNPRTEWGMIGERRAAGRGLEWTQW